MNQHIELIFNLYIKCLYRWIKYLLLNDLRDLYLYSSSKSIAYDIMNNSFHLSSRKKSFHTIYIQEKYRYLFCEIQKSSSNLINDFQNLFLYTKERDKAIYRLGFYCDNIFIDPNIKNIYFINIEIFENQWNKFKRLKYLI